MLRFKPRPSSRPAHEHGPSRVTGHAREYSEHCFTLFRVCFLSRCGVVCRGFAAAAAASPASLAEMCLRGEPRRAFTPRVCSTNQACKLATNLSLSPPPAPRQLRCQFSVLTSACRSNPLRAYHDEVLVRVVGLNTKYRQRRHRRLADRSGRCPPTCYRITTSRSRRRRGSGTAAVRSPGRYPPDDAAPGVFFFFFFTQILVCERRAAAWFYSFKIHPPTHRPTHPASDFPLSRPAPTADT